MALAAGAWGGGAAGCCTAGEFAATGFVDLPRDAGVHQVTDGTSSAATTPLITKIFAVDSHLAGGWIVNRENGQQAPVPDPAPSSEVRAPA